MWEEKKVDKDKAAAAAVAAAIAASGAAVDASFDGPADILQNNPQPVVQYADDVTAQDDDQQDDEKNKKGGATTVKESFRESILELPLAIRAIVVLPLWVIGNGVTFLAGIAMKALSPVMGLLVKFGVMALVILAGFTLAAKAMFPDLPLKKILNRHTLKWVLIVTLIAAAADVILSVVYPGYASFKYLIEGALTLIPMGALTIWFARRENRRRAELKEQERIDAENSADDSNEIVLTSLGQKFVIRDTRDNNEAI